MLTQSPLQCGQRPSAGAVKFPIWCASDLLENPIALFWCVLDGVTATVSGVQCLKTFGVETGDEICDCVATFATSIFGSVVEVHTVRDGKKAFGSSDNDGWVGVASGEVFEVVLFIGGQGSERIFVGAWHVKRLHPQQVTH